MSLHDILTPIHDYGFILDASFEPALPGFGGVIEHLRASVGAPIGRRRVE